METEAAFIDTRFVAGNYSGVYLVRNVITRNCYIGSAVVLRNRKRLHLNLLRNGKHHSFRFQEEFTKYGESEFEWSVLEMAEPGCLADSEQAYIDEYKPFYNICLFVYSGLGRKHSEETLKKMSDAQKGRVVTEEHRKRLSEARKGKPVSEESLAKRKATNDIRFEKRRKEKETEKQNRLKAAAARGPRTFSYAARQKMSVAGKGRKKSAETRKRMSESNRRRPPFTAERCRKISEAKKAGFARRRMEAARKQPCLFPDPFPALEK